MTEREDGEAAVGPEARRQFVLYRRPVTPGSAPGTIHANPVASPTRLRGVSAGPKRYLDTEPKVVDGEWEELPSGGSTDWLQVQGLADVELLAAIAGLTRMPDLVLEDVVNVDQRSKVDESEEGTFVVLRVPAPATDAEVATHQLSLFLADDLLVSFEESPSPLFDPVHERLTRKGRRIRSAGPGYLLYALVDAVIDSFFPLLERIAERLDRIEGEIAQDPRKEHLEQLHRIKHQVLLLRRDLRPVADVVKSLLRSEDERLGQGVEPYLRDCLDHAQRLVDQVEHLRDTASAAMDLHQSVVGNRMNEVMKLLTIIATIFIPLSFVTSLYGMNFDQTVSDWNMPELSWPYGYPAVLLLMTGAAAALLLWFRRRGYIGSSRGS